MYSNVHSVLLRTRLPAAAAILRQTQLPCHSHQNCRVENKSFLKIQKKRFKLTHIICKVLKIWTDSAMESHISCVSNQDGGYSQSIFVTEPSEEFVCPLCLNILKNPKQCLRGHTFCRS